MLNLKDLEAISEPITSQIDRPETPTPQANYQQYNGGVSPKSKPKINLMLG